MTQATYAVRIRDTNNNTIGEVDDFTSLELVMRHNAVGNFTLVVSRFSKSISLLTQAGAGIYVVRFIAGVSTVLFSGPIQKISRKGGTDQNITFTGPDDLIWLQWRLAWPYSTWYYLQVAGSGVSLLRYYRLGDKKGATTVHDSKGSQTGTIYGPGALYALGWLGGIVNDSDTCVSVAGGYATIGLPNTSLPNGNNPWTIEALVQVTAYPSGANGTIAGWGDWSTTRGSAFLGLNTSGGLFCGTYFGDTPASAAISKNVWHHVVGTWDGTTLKCYVDGSLTGSATPGALVIANPPPYAAIGCAPASGYATAAMPNSSYIDEVAFYNTTMSLATVQAHAGYALNPYGQQAQDTKNGIASTVLLHYISLALGTTAAQPDRRMLVMPTDPLIGSTVGWDARNDNLLAICSLLALAGGDIGFSVTQNGTALDLNIYQPVNQTNAVFTEDNLADWTYETNAPKSDVVVVAGAGTGVARLFYVGYDQTAISVYGRQEVALNFTAGQSGTTLGSAASDRLYRDSSAISVSITPLDTTNIIYGRDYNLGDQITVLVEGLTETNVVREVHLTLSSDGADLYEPTIGTPDTAVTRNSYVELLRELRRNKQSIDSFANGQ